MTSVPAPISSFLSHDLKLRARFAAIRSQISDGNSLIAGAPIRKGRVRSKSKKPVAPAWNRLNHPFGNTPRSSKYLISTVRSNSHRNTECLCPSISRSVSTTALINCWCAALSDWAKAEFSGASQNVPSLSRYAEKRLIFSSNAREIC